MASDQDYIYADKVGGWLGSKKRQEYVCLFQG